MTLAELKISSLPVDFLIPYANNSRTHSTAQVAKIASSIKEFGFNDPIAIDAANGIIAGHGRLMAARLLGLKDVPTIQLGHLNKEQQRAYILAHNRIFKYDHEWRDADLGVRERSRGKVENDDKVNWTDAYSLFTGTGAYVWHAAYFTHIVAKNLIDCGYEIVSNIIWVKQHFALSHGDYHWQHDSCWYVVKKGHKHNWQGARDQATTWDILSNNSFGNANPEKTWGHGTQKPVECMARPIQNNSKPGEYVYDPFGGSGTTLIACEKLGRKCFMMEISPVYVDVIIQRWQEFTGKKATLETNGLSFEDVANGRKV